MSIRLVVSFAECIRFSHFFDNISVERDSDDEDDDENAESDEGTLENFLRIECKFEICFRRRR